MVGIDLGLAFTLSDALGFDTAAVADLLSEAEAGLLEGLAGLRSESDT